MVDAGYDFLFRNPRKLMDSFDCDIFSRGGHGGRAVRHVLMTVLLKRKDFLYRISFRSSYIFPRCSPPAWCPPTSCTCNMVSRIRSTRCCLRGDQRWSDLPDANFLRSIPDCSTNRQHRRERGTPHLLVIFMPWPFPRWPRRDVHGPGLWNGGTTACFT
jgi:hypothetical protein